MYEFARDVKFGLESERKFINPKYFYDRRGSELFELICIQPEYYVTRTEFRIIIKNISAMMNYFGDKNVSIIELGSGSSKKTKIILKYFLDKQHNNLHYFPIDVSHEMLFKSTKNLSNDLPQITIHPIASDYFDGIRQTNEYINLNHSAPDKKLILFFGSSLGNLEPKDSIYFLKTIGTKLNKNDFVLIGFDLVKKKEILELAYNDSEGVTSSFNLNILNRINNELGGEFNLDLFKHLAFFNEDKKRIEMHLVSSDKQNIDIRKINQSINFQKDETIHTENSYKYTVDDINDLAKNSDLKVEKHFIDDNNWFSLSLLSRS
jgi:dimethylhistidine N-methyltransferase